jgi:hypothetical protein
MIQKSAVLDAFMNNPVGELMRSVAWVYPVAQIVHFFGLCFLLGAIVLVDLRLMGFLREMPLRAALRLIPVAIVAFVVNLATGLAFFASDPYRFWFDSAFQWKMLAILAAGANALWFTLFEQRKALTQGDSAHANAVTKACAGLSIGLWFTVILCGRLLPIYQP